jgi:hypothetical protein
MFKKFFLFIFALPLTIFLDFILYAMLKSCPACGNFSQFLAQEGALSFPIIVEFYAWVEQVYIAFHPSAKHKISNQHKK